MEHMCQAGLPSYFFQVVVSRSGCNMKRIGARPCGGYGRGAPLHTMPTSYLWPKLDTLF